jgi:hypothetical protein
MAAFIPDAKASGFSARKLIKSRRANANASALRLLTENDVRQTLATLRNNRASTVSAVHSCTFSEYAYSSSKSISYTPSEINVNRIRQNIKNSLLPSFDRNRLFALLIAHQACHLGLKATVGEPPSADLLGKEPIEIICHMIRAKLLPRRSH